LRRRCLHGPSHAAMGKKAAAPPPDEPPEEPPAETEPPAEHLEGDFVFPDGSEYSGEYLKKGDKVTFHGKGRLKTGPEVFQGTFENGLYKEGTFNGADGSVYTGSFHNNLFHGPGEYAWPDGRVYRGMWQEGLMHGRGEFENFSFGVDRVFQGFCARGKFVSSLEGQENARRDFLSEYSTAYSKSALAALQDISARAAAAAEPADPKAKKAPEEGPAEIPKEYLILPPDSADESAPDPSAGSSADPVSVLEGPFPDGSALRASTLAAFAGRFVEGAESPGSITVFDDTTAGNLPQDISSFDPGRLKKEQLSHCGQCVAFAAADAEPGTPCLLVFVNLFSGFDAAKALWKLVHCEDAPPPQTA